MSQPLADDPPPHRPTRVQASLRRRAYKRGRGPTADGLLPPLDELDDVPEPDATDLEAEEQLEQHESVADLALADADALEAIDDDLDLAEADDDVDELVEVEEALDAEDVVVDDDYDEQDDLPGGVDPAHYDELDLALVAHEPEVVTLDDVEQLEAESDLEVADDLDEDLDDDDLDDEPALVAPAAAAPTRRRRAKKGYVPARRVRRTIRRIDPLSLAKLVLVFNLCFLVMTLVAGVIIWTAASASGSIDNIESFVEDIGFEDFRIQGGQLLRGLVLGGLVLSVAGTFFALIMGVLFNLLSDLVGGIRITMVEPDESA